MNKEKPRDNYGDRSYRRVVDGDRMYMDRLLVVDYRLLYSINQELNHIAFLGPLIDRTEELNGYKTIVLIKDNESKEEVEKRIENLCFQAEVKTIKELEEMKPYSTISAIITTKMRYPVLKKTSLIGNYYVLQ